MKNKRVLLGVSGSIAAYKSGDLIRRLIEEGSRVSVVMTKEAEQFITPLTLSSLAGEKVYRGTIEGEEDSYKMPHIELARQTDVLVIAPATANVIAKLACGIADDLLTCISLATNKPIVIVPAMNVEMYKNKIVQENCSRLKKAGFLFVEPTEGKLACGEFGQGRMADVEDIVKSLKKFLGK